MEKSLQRALQTLKVSDDAIRDLKNARRLRELDIAKKFCPAKEGDTVEITGYSYTGKEMLVSAILGISESCGEYGWVVSGTVLKANGQKSAYKTKFVMRFPDESDAAKSKQPKRARV